MRPASVGYLVIAFKDQRQLGRSLLPGSGDFSTRGVHRAVERAADCGNMKDHFAFLQDNTGNRDAFHILVDTVHRAGSRAADLRNMDYQAHRDPARKVKRALPDACFACIRRESLQREHPRAQERQRYRHTESLIHSHARFLEHTSRKTHRTV